MEEEKIKKQFVKIPDAPGIYLFYNSKKQLLYVGKATSLKNRVKSYFSGQRTTRPIEEMIHEVVDIKWKETDSVLEAIILEGEYIKNKKPKYNVLWKDDKSWNYIVITKDDYPRIETLRSHDYVRTTPPGAGELYEHTNFDTVGKKYKYVFGPYPGLNARATMKILRRLFFISTCNPNQKRPCLYYEMKQCLGVCTGDITAKEYRQKVIRPLATFLGGRKKQLIKSLEIKMRKASREENFEEAGRLRNQIGRLQHIHDIALLNKEFIGNKIGNWKLEIGNYEPRRIEGYDISNLGESGKVGSMVTFVNGEPDKNLYRRFKIKTVKGQSDVDCLEEVLQRRLKHDEWFLPDLFLVDGGKPQVNRAKKVLLSYNVEVPLVGIAKGPSRKKNEFVFANDYTNDDANYTNNDGASDTNTKFSRELVKWVNNNQSLLIQVRDEAHRFAIAYQRKLRRLN